MRTIGWFKLSEGLRPKDGDRILIFNVKEFITSLATYFSKSDAFFTYRMHFEILNENIDFWSYLPLEVYRLPNKKD